jgi:hypothetical protein
MAVKKMDEANFKIPKITVQNLHNDSSPDGNNIITPVIIDIITNVASDDDDEED